MHILFHLFNRLIRLFIKQLSVNSFNNVVLHGILYKSYQFFQIKPWTNLNNTNGLNVFELRDFFFFFQILIRIGLHGTTIVVRKVKEINVRT